MEDPFFCPIKLQCLYVCVSVYVCGGRGHCHNRQVLYIELLLYKTCVMSGGCRKQHIHRTIPCD